MAETAKMARKHGGQHRQLRIIGGEWRGRKLLFPAADGLRPTPDRVRETLFNWLAAHVRDARCLDLFAGSGALGLEALSRGAAHCDFVEQGQHSADTIERHLHTLACDRGKVWRADARQWLKAERGGQVGGIYDIVFLDPPFDQGLVSATCIELEGRQLLAPAAHIYVETGIREPAPEVPGQWALARERQAGEVRYQLFSQRALTGV